MIQTATGHHDPPPTGLLQDIWIDAAQAAIHREEWPTAVRWLRASLARWNANETPIECGLVRATLAWALWQQGTLKEAVHEANAASPIVKQSSSDDPHTVTLARARISRILGENCWREQQYLAAFNCFYAAYAGYSKVGGEPRSRDWIEAGWRFAEAAELLGRLRVARDSWKETVQKLEILVLQPAGSRPEREQRRRDQRQLTTAIIRVVALQSILGDFQSAAVWYRRWKGLIDDSPSENAADLAEVILGLVTFAELFAALADWNQSAELLHKARSLLGCLHPLPTDLEARIDIANIELTLSSGQLSCAECLLCEREKAPPVDRILQFRLRIQRCRWCLAIGQEKGTLPALECLLGEIQAICATRPDLVVQVMSLIAHARSVAGDTKPGSECAEEALQLALDRLGLQHWLTATALFEFGFSYASNGRAHDAGPVISDAISRLTFSVGASHPVAIDWLAALAEVQWTAGRTDEAMQHCCRALGFFPAGSFPAGCARVLNIVARCHQKTDDAVAAESDYRAALAHWDEHSPNSGHRHPEQSRTQIGLSTLLVRTGRHAEAEKLFGNAWKLLLDMKKSPSAAAYELNHLGNAYYENSLFHEAAWLYDKARHAYDKELGSAHASTKQAADNMERARKHSTGN